MVRFCKYFYLYFLLQFFGETCAAQDLKKYSPHFLEAKLAGSIGQYSFAAGYNLFKEQARASVHFGHVLKGSGGPLNIASVKLFYSPFSINLNESVKWRPMDFGIKTSYHFGDSFYLRWPDRYPKGYYWWSSALRLHLAAETSLTGLLENSKPFRAASVFLEFNTNDLYLVSYLGNTRSIQVFDIIKAGIGARVFVR